MYHAIYLQIPPPPRETLCSSPPPTHYSQVNRRPTDPINKLHNDLWLIDWWESGGGGNGDRSLGWTIQYTGRGFRCCSFISLVPRVANKFVLLLLLTYGCTHSRTSFVSSLWLGHPLSLTGWPQDGHGDGNKELHPSASSGIAICSLGARVFPRSHRHWSLVDGASSLAALHWHYCCTRQTTRNRPASSSRRVVDNNCRL